MSCVDKKLHLWHVGAAAAVKIGLILSDGATKAKPSPIALAWDPLDSFTHAELSVSLHIFY